MTKVTEDFLIRMFFIGSLIAIGNLFVEAFAR